MTLPKSKVNLSQKRWRIKKSVWTGSKHGPKHETACWKTPPAWRQYDWVESNKGIENTFHVSPQCLESTQWNSKAEY